MSRVSQLAYVVAEDTELDRWRTLAEDVLGMVATEDGPELRLKMDSAAWRIAVQRTGNSSLARIGWLASSEAAFLEVKEALDVHGLGFTELSSEEVAARGVSQGLLIDSEDSFAHEVVLGGDFGEATNQPESPFVAGDLGMGHLVIEVADMSSNHTLFRDVLQMVVREDMVTAVGIPGRFYGCNPRHHSAALIESLGDGAPSQVMHVMVEYANVDEVGSAMDRAQKSGFAARTSLGRHRTDHMLSFYLTSPSGFDVEVGCEGLLVENDETWEGDKDHMRAPLWGHAGMEAFGRHPK